MADRIDLTNLDRAAVLCALYDAAKPQGLGFLSFSPADLTHDEADKLLRQGSYFDYLRGRVMKVDLGRGVLDTRLYDRDNGSGAARRALERAGIPVALLEPEQPQ